MISLLLQFLAGIRISSKTLDAVEALEQPAISSAARNYRITAFWLLILALLLAVPAAVIHTIIGECVAFDIFGFGALAVLGLCILCVIRSQETNRAEQ